MPPAIAGKESIKSSNSRSAIRWLVIECTTMKAFNRLRLDLILLSAFTTMYNLLVKITHTHTLELLTTDSDLTKQAANHHDGVFVQPVARDASGADRIRII